MSSIYDNNSTQSIKVVHGKAEIILDQLEKDDLFVYSDKSLFQLKYSKEIIAKQICVSRSGIDKNFIDAFILNNKFKRIVALGNGKVTDVAKYIAYDGKNHLTVIPSILSNNVYFTDKACLINDNDKITYQAKIPEVLIYDENFLLKADFRFHFYGLMDIACMYVSLIDWKLANLLNNEEIDEEIYMHCEKVLGEMENQRSIILKKDKESLNIIFDLLKETGDIVCRFGSGRPVSGAEHIFSKKLEQESDVYHGESVAIGILLFSTFTQSQDVVNFLFEYVDELGILKKIRDDVSKDAVLKVLKNIKTKEKRFTILNVICPIDSKKAKTLVNRIYA